MNAIFNHQHMHTHNQLPYGIAPVNQKTARIPCFNMLYLHTISITFMSCLKTVDLSPFCVKCIKCNRGSISVHLIVPLAVQYLYNALRKFFF